MKNYAIYNHDLVILDVQRDAFEIVQDVNQNNKLKEIVKAFKRDYLILYDIGALKDIGYIDDEVAVTNSFLEERWMLPTVTAPRAAYDIGAVGRFIQFSLACWNIKRKGFPWVVEKINAKKNKIKSKRELSSSESETTICKAISYVSSVFYLLDANSHCLTYSYCLATLLIEKGIDAKLVVGVRTRPFFSHAWVEVDDVIINDDRFLREKLAVIFNV